jgi:hypothetical protein
LGSLENLAPRAAGEVLSCPKFVTGISQKRWHPKNKNNIGTSMMTKLRTAVPISLCGIALIYALLDTNASAHDFALDDTDIIGSWNAATTLGTAIRMQGQDKTLVGRSFGSDGKPKGGVGTDIADDGDLNFKKGEPYSTVLKVLGDVDLKYQNYGVFLRGMTLL